MQQLVILKFGWQERLTLAIDTIDILNISILGGVLQQLIMILFSNIFKRQLM